MTRVTPSHRSSWALPWRRTAVRRNRVLEMEIEILKRASAYFARENVLPKQ